MVKDPGRFGSVYEERGYPHVIKMENGTLNSRTNEDKLPKSIKKGWN